MRIAFNVMASSWERFKTSKTFSILAVFAGANMIGSLLSGIGGLIQARWVTPEILGEFNKYYIPATYVSLALVVVQDGLVRQFPYLMGKGRVDDAIRLAGVAKTWEYIVSISATLVFGMLSVRAAIASNWYGAVGWGIQIPFAIMQSYGCFLQIIYRRSMEFKRLSYNSLISGVLVFLSLIFVRFFSYYGLALKNLVLYLSRMWLDAKYLPVKIRAVWDWRIFVDLAKISIPLSGVGYIRSSLMTSVFGFLVLKYCGARELGLYGVAAAFQGFAMIFNNSLIQIFHVRIATCFGETDSIRSCVRSVVLPTVMSVLLATVLAGFLCVVIGPFIRFVLPKYEEAIPIIYVLSLAMPIGALALPTEALRASLQYKMIYLMATVKLGTLVGAIFVGPKTIVWFAFCTALGAGVDVVVGYCCLMLSAQHEVRDRNDKNLI